MKEIYKDIEGFEGLYQVSNLGRVKSLNYNHTGKEGVLTPALNSYGYCKVSLWKNGKMRVKSIHRLVADAFIDNPNNLPCVNHINGVKTDNSVENLEWCTYKENNAHAIENNLRPSQIKIVCKETGKEYKSIRHAADDVGTYESFLRYYVNTGKCYKGFHFIPL